eukprot:8049095-Lingulodinium_polyedra.AAC.1
MRSSSSSSSVRGRSPSSTWTRHTVFGSPGIVGKLRRWFSTVQENHRMVADARATQTHRARGPELPAQSEWRVRCKRRLNIGTTQTRDRLN